MQQLKAKSASAWEQGLPKWDNYLSDFAITGDGDGYNVAQALHEFVLSTAQNAGYTDTNPDGTTRKWGINGSGSRGWIALYTAMREDGVLPGFNLTNPDAVDEYVRPYFEGLKGPEELRGNPIPFVNERIAIYKEICSPRAREIIDGIVAGARQADGSYVFTMENCVTPLADAFPTAFGADPLLKKACLVPILLAANAQSHGIYVQAKVPLPADYRVPQTYHKWGVLEFDPALVDTINSNALLDQNDPRVLAVRAATVKVGEILRERTGLDSHILDAIPFVASSPEHSDPGTRVHDGVTAGKVGSAHKAERPINSHGLYI